MSEQGMMRYIGTKLVNARSMTRAEYNAFRGWELPKDENGDDAGYLIEDVNAGKANTPQYKGYVSWSPADVFFRSYSLVTGMTFGQAIEALKEGHRVARAGWNGKGMWLALSGDLCGKAIPAESFWSPHNRAFAEQNGGGAVVQPCITMKTAQDQIQMGWLASQSDMLAEDWMVV